MDICQHGYFYCLSSYNFILEESPKKNSLYIVQLSINITTNYIKLNLQKLTGMEEYKLKTWGMYQLLINSSVCHVFEVSRKFLPLYTFFKPLELSFWVWHIVADPRQIIVWEEEKQLFWLTLKVSDKIICPWISKNCVGIKMFLKHSKEVGEGSVNLLEMKLHVLHVHVLPIKCHLSYD